MKKVQGTWVVQCVDAVLAIGGDPATVGKMRDLLAEVLAGYDAEPNADFQWHDYAERVRAILSQIGAKK